PPLEPTTALPPTAATAPPAAATISVSTQAPSSTLPVNPTSAADGTATPTAPIGSTTASGTPTNTQIILNVKQYGAAGNGTTDDTTAIQAAIDAVPASGGTVFFPPGTYIVAPKKTVGIVIKSSLRLAGAGTASILKIRDHLGDWQRLLSPRDLAGNVENFAVEDLTFDANIQNNPESLINEKKEQTYQTFIHITSGRNLTVRRCRFAPYSGVWAVSFVGQTIDNCAVTDSYFQFVMRDANPDYDNSAVYIEGSHYVFSGNTFESVPIPKRGARACMEAHGGPAEVFTNTATGYQTILNIVGSYYPGGSPGDVNCHDNICTDALLGIMLWPTMPNNLKNVTVTNNTINIAQTKHGAVDTAGIYILFSVEAKGLAGNITIAKNMIRFQDEGAGRSGDFYYNSSGIGLHNLGGVSGVVIDGNSIELSPAVGVAIGLPEPGKRSFDNVRVTNNTITNPGQNLGFPTTFRAGVLVNSSASNIAISGNTITDTFPTPHCPTAIAFDAATGNVYKEITVTNNTITATGKNLPLILPAGTQR
ncbi:MAG: glycoside hydrolase family 55 protein, partial [Chloroflexota bacterium]|nr:glycoside hydrolase family 55 protein [Chloroflexota bacterium]